MRSTGGRWPLLAVLLLALGLRLLLWSQPLHEPANDEVEYIAVARDLLAGRGWQFYDTYHWLRAPLYPLFLAGSLWAAQGDLHLAALPTLLLSVANVFLCYRLARALAGERPALIAALLTALLWTNVTFASLYMAETLFAFLFMAGVLCLIDGGGLRAPYVRIALAGVCLGLATLTRSVALLFLPVVALLLLLGPQTTSDEPRRRVVGGGWTWSMLRLHARRWPAAAAFLLAAALTIAPWTIRNTLAYGQPILVETGLSYNLWAFNEPREDLDTIERTLERIPNPAERSDYATARGLERLREDPGILLRKLWPNWVFLARVKPIQDRFLMESYYASVELPLFVAALVFDDLLYVVIALAAIVGFLRSPGARSPAVGERGGGNAGRAAFPALSPRALLLAWVIYAIVTILLTHGEARYRHFLFPALIPYAACALTHSVAAPRRPGALRPARLLTPILWAIFLWTVATSYPREWAAENLARGWHTLAGDLALWRGDYPAAIAAYERAGEAQRAPDPWLRAGDAARAQGDTARALDAYRKARRLIPLYIPASAKLGDLLRALGDEEGARVAFAGTFADAQQMADWSFRELRPAPRDSIAVGDGLDFGYVGGVYPAEQLDGSLARWTGGRAELRLAGPAHGLGVLRLRLAAPRPPGAPPVAAQVCAGGGCRPLTVSQGWRVYMLPLAAPPGAEVTVELRSETFVGPDGRRLGVIVDEVWLR